MQELIGQLQDRVLTSPPEAYSRDYGRMLKVPPRAVVRPRTAEEVQATVAFARRQGLRVVARGHGCSTRGQALSEHLLLDMRELTGLELVGEGVASVGPGWGWGALQDALVARGLSNRVLTDDRQHTVGGTLSVGGYGSMSMHRGGQVDQVVALDIVTGTGELLHAHRDGPHAELFRYTLCGLGQVGIIVRAHLKVQPSRPGALIQMRPAPPGATLADLRREVLGATPPWDHCLVFHYIGAGQRMVTLARDLAAEPAELAEDAQFIPDLYAQKSAMAAAVISHLVNGLVESGLAPHEDQVFRLWNDYFLPADQADAFSAIHYPLFPDPRFALGTFGSILRAPPRGERLPLSPMPDSEVVHSFSGPFCNLPAAFLDDYRARFDQAIEACLALGGRVYLYGYHPKSIDFYRRQFGAATVDAWRAVKARHDPGNILGAPLF